MDIIDRIYKLIKDRKAKAAKCCECGSVDCCNGVYAKYDVATGEWLGCFLKNGAEECHECSEAHKLANEAKAALNEGDPKKGK